MSRRGIIADTGYGIGGKLVPGDSAWIDSANLRARINDGLVAVTYANPMPTWDHKAYRLRSILPQVHQCWDHRIKGTSRRPRPRNTTDYQGDGSRHGIHHARRIRREFLHKEDRKVKSALVSVARSTRPRISDLQNTTVATEDKVGPEPKRTFMSTSVRSRRAHH